MEIIQTILRNLDSKQKKFPIYIDNLHTPFILLDEDYLMPQVSNYILQEDEILKLIQLYSKFLPNTLKDLNFILNPISTKEHSKLIFAKEFSSRGNKFVYQFSIEIKYLGGADSTKISKQATQEFFPSYFTDRIYFQSRIIPVSEITYIENQIVNFNPIKLNQVINYIHSDFFEKDKPEFFSEMFDEQNYKPILEPLFEKLKVSTFWKLGKIYEPLGIEYLSFVLNLISVSSEKNIIEFQKFSALFTNILGFEKLNQDSIYLFQNWLEKFDFKRRTSPSGNICWEIFET